MILNGLFKVALCKRLEIMFVVCLKKKNPTKLNAYERTQSLPFKRNLNFWFISLKSYLTFSCVWDDLSHLSFCQMTDMS